MTGVPWWSPEAPPIAARAPKRYGPFRCYSCLDHRWGSHTNGVYKTQTPCPDCNPKGDH